MKQTKHLLLLLLAFMLSVTETFAQAVGTDFKVDNIKYIVTAMDLTTHNNTAAVSYIGGTGAVTVPPSVVHSKNKEIVYITESKEYTNCADGVTSITFSEGYTTMGKGCYAKSKNLTKVTFPKSFTTMNPGCFEANNKLTSFEVVSGNTKFSTNSDGWLLADGGTTLQAYPTGLSGDVTIPNTITKIAPTAFNVCASLGKVTIPASVTSIASGITASFLAVGTYFEVDDSNPNYKSVGGVLFNKDVSELITFPKDYSGSLYPFNANQNIYVKRSKVNDYKTVWEVDGHTLNITAEIPQTTHSYGATRCYPFDVQYDNNGDVRPYLPVDFSHMTAANPYAKARRIDDGYVPAFLGVLLHSRNAASATSYCEMTDTQDHHAVNDPSGKYSAATYKMVGIVEDTQVMSDANNNLYAFSKSKGQFLKIKQAPGNMMPRFSAYLKLDSSNQAKGFSFRFDDDDPSTTGIENIEIAEDANDSAPYYNLNGMRVNNPAKGVYIHNGKKVIIK